MATTFGRLGVALRVYGEPERRLGALRAMPTAVPMASRFSNGEQVYAKVGDRWVAGEVIGVGVEGMAYRIRLVEMGKDVYAPRDTDWFVRKDVPALQVAKAENSGTTRRFKVEVFPLPNSPRLLFASMAILTARWQESVWVRSARGWIPATVTSINIKGSAYRVRIKGGKILAVSQDNQHYIRKDPPPPGQKGRGPSGAVSWNDSKRVFGVCFCAVALLVFVGFLISILFHKKQHVGLTAGGLSPPAVEQHNLDTMPHHPDWIKRSKLLDEPAPGVAPFDW